MIDIRVVDPVIVDDHGDVQVFPTVEEAQGYMEEIDVENNEYVVHDSIGNRLELYVQGRSIVARVAGRPPEPEVVAEKLRRFLRQVGAEAASESPLSELIEKCQRLS